ncbi:hypothetical protein [Nostoc sp.]|uniref:hypothetical protein n=1 Tax=Nostoc sp. TaxID=1180 RepID=UPI002FF90F6B
MKRHKSSPRCCSGDSPKTLAIASLITPSGGVYSVMTLTWMPRSMSASWKWTEPEFAISASSCSS